MFIKVFAESVAHGAPATEIIFSFRMTSGANVFLSTSESVFTSVIVQMHAANSSENQMRTDFSGRRVVKVNTAEVFAKVSVRLGL